MNKSKIRILVLLIQPSHRNKPRKWNIIISVDKFLSIHHVSNCTIYV